MYLYFLLINTGQLKLYPPPCRGGLKIRFGKMCTIPDSSKAPDMEGEINKMGENIEILDVLIEIEEKMRVN